LKRERNEPDPATIAMVKAFLECEADDEEYESDELICDHPYLTCYVDDTTAALICSISSQNTNQITDAVLFDSDAGVSLSNPQVVERHGFVIQKLIKLILLKFENGNC